MQLPLQIVFRNLEWTEAIAVKVRERAEKLDQYCDSIMKTTNGAGAARSRRTRCASSRRWASAGRRPARSIPSGNTTSSDKRRRRVPLPGSVRP